VNRRGVAAALVLAAAVGVLTIGVVATHATHGQARATVPHGDRAVAGIPVSVGVDACGLGWRGGKAGPTTFALWDNGGIGTEVYLENAETRQVYLDAEGLDYDTTRSFSVDLAPGRYRFFCIPPDTGGLAGPVVTVSGRGDGHATPGLVPLSDGDLIPAINRYHRWVTRRLPVLQREVTALAGDVRRGDLSAARRDWLRGHLTYQTLGAAYDAFGADGDAIDALPSRSTPPAQDKRLRGFHKVEALLWDGAPAARIAPYATALEKAVVRLRADFAAERLNTIDIGLRAHEILENAVQFVLTGADDAGSHSSLATLRANLTGTYRALRPLRQLLAGRDAHRAELEQWLARSRALVTGYDHHGTWTPLAALSTAERERLDATLEQTLELLSQVASITEPRGSNEQ
jgi:iron uptake system component EfeO